MKWKNRKWKDSIGKFKKTKEDSKILENKKKNNLRKSRSKRILGANWFKAIQMIKKL